MPIKGMPLLLFCTIIIINITNMTVKEIFDHPAVKAVEMEILDTIRDEERCRSCRNGEDTRLAVQHLLSVRKRILNGMFEWADEYYSLLSEFNNVLVEAQCEMRERLFRLSENVKETENWNEGLDKEKTKDMKLCYAFHNINAHTAFSIFDLLWVRDFYIARDTANGNAGYYCWLN